MIQGEIKPPHIYSEWAEILDILRLKKDDENILQALYQGSIEWQTGVAERFILKLTASINARLNAATDKFQKDMNNSRGQESMIAYALFALRKELIFLSKAINLPALPERERKQCYELVMNRADSIQSSLEDSAKSDKTGRLGNIVRSHKVNSLMRGENE